MTDKYTPEKVAELVAESRVKHCSDCDHFIGTMGTALTAVSAERDVEHGRAERLEENRSSWIGDAMELVAKAEGKADRLHKAITEALAVNEKSWRRADVRHLLRAALDNEGNDDE